MHEYNKTVTFANKCSSDLQVKCKSSLKSTTTPPFLRINIFLKSDMQFLFDNFHIPYDKYIHSSTVRIFHKPSQSFVLA